MTNLFSIYFLKFLKSKEFCKEKMWFLLDLFYNSLYSDDNGLKISEIISTLEKEGMPPIPNRWIKTDLTYQEVLQKMSKRLSFAFFKKKAKEEENKLINLSARSLQAIELDFILNLPEGDSQKVVKDVLIYLADKGD